MGKWVKVQYWDGSKRYIKEEQVDAVQAAIVRGKPFRLTHSKGVDFVQPKAISLITEPSWTEYPELPQPKQKALPERREVPESERVPQEISELLMKACRVRIVEKDKEKADKIKAEYERKLKEWKDSRGNGIMEG